MMTYRCQVSDHEGVVREILKEAGDTPGLTRMLSDEGLYLISCKEENRQGRKKFSAKVIIDFTDTMALLLRSGLTVRDSLKIAESIFREGKAGRLIQSLTSDLNRGSSFPEALEKMGADFSPLYRGMVHIGDRTGSLEDIFSRLSRYLNDEKAMKEKIRGALIYPAMVVSVLFLFMVVIFFFIFPRLKNSFSGQSLDLVFQRFTLMMYFLFIPLVGVLLFILFLFFSSKSEGKLKVWADRVTLKLPLIGKINMIRSCLNLSFSLEVLTSSGFSVETALKESEAVLSNRLLKEGLKHIGQLVLKGWKLSEAFASEKVWPARIALWIGIGEASGDIGAVFSQLRIFYQGELDKSTTRIMQLVEPALVLLLGAFMLLFVILFIVPLLSIFGSVI